MPSSVRPAQIEEDLTVFRAERTDVTPAVYDLMGRKVATLAAGARSAGTHRARMDATALPSGTYVVRLRAGEEEMTRRITVVK